MEENRLMEDVAKALENVRAQCPLIHNITNYVTVNDVANILLACGGSPIMSDEPEDVEDITTICGGLNINIGTLNQRSIEGMFRAGKKAAELGHDEVSAGRIKSVVPDAGRKVCRVQQSLRLGGEPARQFAGSVVAELPALAEQLEVEVAPPHGGVKHPGAAIGRLPQLQIGISAAQVLYLDGQEQGRIVFLCGHGTVHLFKIAAGIHSGSPLWFWMMCQKPSIGCSLPAL